MQAYVDMFSKSMDLEYKDSGISIHNQAPAFVATKMSKIRRPRLDAPSPAVWVAAAVGPLPFLHDHRGSIKYTSGPHHAPVPQL